MSLSTILSIAGAALIAFGTGIIFYDLIFGQKKRDLHTQITNFIETLELGSDDLKEISQGPKIITKDGLNITEAAGIMFDAMPEANKKNRKLALDLSNQINAMAERRRPWIVLAMILTLVGGCLQLVAFFVSGHPT